LKKKIALFASGTGSNVVNFIEYFKNSNAVEIALVLSNKNEAPVLQKAEKAGVETISITNSAAANGLFMCSLLSSYKIDFIVLAGYLRLIPVELNNMFADRIVNIHPSLLPKYGGKGMYGAKVHEAVISNAEKESGITIHYVNNEYDKGMVIFQAKVDVLESDNADSLAAKIHQLEHEYYPKVVEGILAETF